MQAAFYSCTALAGTNLVGTLKPDDNGYYEMVLGAIGIENSAGEHYVDEPEVRRLFDEGSSLHRRIKNGNCRAEYGHPKRQPGMTDREFFERILSFEELKTCAHIKDVRVDPNVIKDDQGNKVVACIGHVQPTGALGEALSKQFENPDENVPFSIRSLTQNWRQGGQLFKRLKTVVGWDYVNEPGIAVAHKYKSPSLEDFSAESDIILPETLSALEVSSEGVSVSLEGSGIDSTLIRTELGWTRVQKMYIPSHNW